MKAIATCATCGAEIELKERKDFESYKGTEMVAHYREQHPEKITGIGIPYSPIRFEDD